MKTMVCGGIGLVLVAGIALPALAVEVLIGSPEGRPAKKPSPAIVNEPFAIDFDADGRLYGVEFTRGNRVFRSTGPLAAGAGTTEVEFVAGVFQQTGSKTPPVKAGAAEAGEVRFNGMHDLAIAADGTIFLADTFNHQIKRFDPRTGRVETVAGTGIPGFSGDGEAAAVARFNQPYCGSLSPDGSRLLIADIKNHRLRTINLKDGTVTTLAGNGMKGSPVDGAKAVESPLAGPRAVCEAADGTVYLVLREGNALVAIRDGRLRTVVNASGKAGYGGDNGPGREGRLSGPKYVCMDRQQRVLIVDTENHCVRRYDPDTEIIELVAGTPPRAGVEVGDDWKTTNLRRPHGARIAPDGRLVIADSDNDRVLIGRY